ncbi:uncharacterized protein V6R79_000071 [Siganus canaliculatus]
MLAFVSADKGALCSLHQLLPNNGTMILLALGFETSPAARLFLPYYRHTRVMCGSGFRTYMWSNIDHPLYVAKIDRFKRENFQKLQHTFCIDGCKWLWIGHIDDSLLALHKYVLPPASATEATGGRLSSPSPADLFDQR